MQEASRHNPQRLHELSYADFLPVFDGFSAGVIIVNRHGRIVYYNEAMAQIDDISRDEVIDRQVTEIYDLTPETSKLMQCLNTQSPIIDRPFLYRTRMGRVANTIHSVYPLFKSKKLTGAICFVREYNVLEETLSEVSIPRQKTRLGNDTRFTFESIVGQAPEFLNAVNTAMMAASTPSPVMLYGETGTGKELFAQAIHNLGDRSKYRYTPVNCAAIPENLLEGILFGTTRGAFTGSRNKPGLFERTNGGTIFLDELNSMALSLQAKILRVLQEHKVRRLGSYREIEVDLKIISSVNQQPHVSISENSLRPDLFYRLGVVFIPIPPLRERVDDIERLAIHFLDKHSQALGRNMMDISGEVLDHFQKYHWPGNVRELEHVIEGAMNLAGSENVMEMRHLQSHLPTLYRMNQTKPASTQEAQHHFPSTSQRIKPRGEPAAAGQRSRNLIQTQSDREKRMIDRALRRHKGNITRAARSIGISRQLMNYKMKKHRISRVEYT